MIDGRRPKRAAGAAPSVARVLLAASMSSACMCGTFDLLRARARSITQIGVAQQVPSAVSRPLSDAFARAQLVGDSGDTNRVALIGINVRARGPCGESDCCGSGGDFYGSIDPNASSADLHFYLVCADKKQQQQQQQPQCACA